MMKDNPLKALEKPGQSIWLDYIRRDRPEEAECSHQSPRYSRGFTGILAGFYLMDKPRFFYQQSFCK
jgi:hypothetical protein